MFLYSIRGGERTMRRKTRHMLRGGDLDILVVVADVQNLHGRWLA
jgi:hypothetical protein